PADLRPSVASRGSRVPVPPRRARRERFRAVEAHQAARGRRLSVAAQGGLERPPTHLGTTDSKGTFGVRRTRGGADGARRRRAGGRRRQAIRFEQMRGDTMTDPAATHPGNPSLIVRIPTPIWLIGMLAAALLI